MVLKKIDGKDILRVNHNAYVFNKRGKRIKNYQGHKNFVIYIETPIKLAKKAEQLSNKTNKKFFFMENGNKYWLPYRTVKHKQYVYIGAKAYIKAANIGEVAGNRLLTNSAVAKLASRSYVNNRKRIPIYNDKGQATKKTLKAKSQIVVDYTVVSDQEDQDNDDGFTYYHIKGTKNEFLWHYDVQKLLSRQGLESKVITGMPGLEEY